MSEAMYYHVTETGLAEGVSLGRITVVLAPAYDSAVHLYLDAAERCIAAERREKSLQLLLNTADQRNADLEAAILKAKAWSDGEAHERLDEILDAVIGQSAIVTEQVQP